MSEATTASEAFERWQAKWTPEAQAERAAKAAAERAQLRAEADRVELTLEALLNKLGFGREYAEHLMQPYCACGHGHDGWDFCQDADDLGWPVGRSVSS